MSASPPDPPSSQIIASSVQERTNATKMFIGAVPDEWELYSDRAEDYTIGPPIGFGASSIVYSATYHPSAPGSSYSVNASAKGKSIPCALKVLDLDSLPPRALQLLQRETTLMSLSKHPNVLRVRGSWMNGHKLYIALRLMNKGSAADVMHYGWPGGMEEDVVRCMLRQALKGLNYLHTNGFIHRDIKAANLLIDNDGTVLLGDLGVAADLAEDTSSIPTSSTSSNVYRLSSTAFSPSPSAPALSLRTNTAKGSHDSKPRIGKRKSFVGTPCWMAPELIQGKQYDSKADIWSFGITALELTQGRPPRSRESPQRVLLRIIQEDPPTLNRDGGVHKYSRAFKEMVDSCLVKDPAKRPTAEELLQTPFFKAAKKKSYLINTILSKKYRLFSQVASDPRASLVEELPPLTQRQERRVVPALLSANSMDSWDFSATANSPTTSVYRRRVLEEFVSAEDQQAPPTAAALFDADDFRVKLGRHHHPLRSAAQAPSLAYNLDLDFDDTDADNPPPSSPSTSRSSILESGTPPSVASSPPNTSAPSSYASSSYLAQRVCVVEKNADVMEGSGATSLVSVAESQTQGTLIGVRPVPTTPVRGVAKAESSDTSTLWYKLKSNVKRPSTKALEPNPFEGSPHGKDKDKGKTMGFSTKGLLSKSSTRSLATRKLSLY
ncbi:hypothetical protein HYPSUDRAFT_52816 [Hypholoma sublateritium FD-334 SS-4]|uniref:Protein kinase domain-containing protein n=1 Tax=Hypholoma sublateritium (strain FD-334 SS-4) TaxID=945553 RepID=A0A0D2Q3G3_HYPSF|nr:hypothetical protein HYPSUDRAFT_52816 [Hypholoma sublateritium FD-334 SS-4]